MRERFIERQFLTTNRYGAEWVVRNYPKFDHETCETNEGWECYPIVLRIDELNDEETAVVTAMRKNERQKAVEIVLNKEARQ